MNSHTIYMYTMYNEYIYVCIFPNPLPGKATLIRRIVVRETSLYGHYMGLIEYPLQTPSTS